MYHVTFPPQSNRASWVFIGLITDLDDNPIDLSACSLVFAIRDPNGQQMLEASTALGGGNGKLTIVDIGRFRWFFTLEDMRSLCVKQYDTGLTLTNDDGTQTVQFSVGPLSIVDGVVP
jgi:hypothetical protein